MGQKTKYITLKSDKPNNFKERMMVLKSNPHIKKGPYSKYKNNVLIETGYYSYNQKDSLWQYYSKAGKLMAKGFYEDGTKKGIWEYYSFQGDLIQTYNHDGDSITYYNIKKEMELYPYLVPAYNNDSTRMCYFIGGLGNLYRTLENDVLYPKKAYAQGETAIVKVSFKIDTLGNTTEVKIQSTADSVFHQEAIRVVESIGKSWTPAIMDKRKVKMSYMLPIKFDLL